MTIKAELPSDLRKTKDAGTRLSNLKNLIKACEDAGWTNNNAQAALCAICGGESGFKAIEEDPHYTSVERVRKIFPQVRSASDSEIAAVINQPRTPEGRQKFFGFVYGTKYPHSSYKEGSMYYGRGLMQITFSSGYKGVAQAVEKLYGKKFDYLGNPDLLLTVGEESSYAILGFFLWKMHGNLDKFKRLQNDPNILQVLLKYCAGSHDSWPKKRRYYEFFLAGGDGEVPNITSEPFPKPTNKDAGASDTQKTDSEIQREPPHKQEALLEDRSYAHSKWGFRDPSGKYPLREYMNEPDTNRLARGVIKGTHVEFKDSIRNTDISLPNGGSYDQPYAPYSAQYPFNKVFETEGGHVLEFDDSPGAERINLFHSKGTYFEIDNNGSQVNHIIGDGYYITERNGAVLIKGICNVTIGGDANVVVHGNVQAEIDGNCDLTSHDCMSINVAKDLAINVGENVEFSVGKNLNFEVGMLDENKPDTKEEDKVFGGFTFKSKGQFEIETPELISFKTAKTFSVESKLATTINSLDNVTINAEKQMLLEAKENLDVKSSKELSLSSKEDFTIKTDKKFNTKSAEKTSINSGENVHVSGTEIHLDGGKVPLQRYVQLPYLTGAGVGVSVKGNDAKDIEKSPEIKLLDIKYNPKSKVTIGPEEHEENKVSESIYFKRNWLLKKYPEPIGASNKKYEFLQPCDRLQGQAVKYEDASDLESANIDKIGGTMSNIYNGNETDEKLKTDEPTIDKNEQTTNQDEIFRSDDVKESEDKKRKPKTSVYSDSKTSSVDSSRFFTNSNGMAAYPPNFKLSEHFVLSQLMAPGTVIKDIQLPGGSIYGSRGTNMYTVNDLIYNLSYLAENVLEFLYKKLGPCGGTYGANDPYGKWQITSGIATMNHTGGRSSYSSDHFKGRAVDIQLKPKRGREEVYNLALQLKDELPAYSQMIMEYMGANSYWIHIALGDGTCNNGKGNDGTRAIKRINTFHNGKYTPGISLFQ